MLFWGVLLLSPGPQVIKCAEAGADLVRITVQGRREAKSCKLIREKLDQLVRKVILKSCCSAVAVVCVDLSGSTTCVASNFSACLFVRLYSDHSEVKNISL